MKNNIYAKYLNESIINEAFSKKEVRDLFFDYALKKELNTNILLVGDIVKEIFSDYTFYSNVGEKTEEDLKDIFSYVVRDYSSEIREEEEMPTHARELGDGLEKNISKIIGDLDSYLGTVYKKQYDKFITDEEVLINGKEGFMNYKEIKKYKMKKGGGVVLIVDKFGMYGKTIFFNPEAYYNILNQLIR